MKSLTPLLPEYVITRKVDQLLEGFKKRSPDAGNVASSVDILPFQSTHCAYHPGSFQQHQATSPSFGFNQVLNTGVLVDK